MRCFAIKILVRLDIVRELRIIQDRHCGHDRYPQVHRRMAAAVNFMRKHRPNDPVTTVAHLRGRRNPASIARRYGAITVRRSRPIDARRYDAAHARRVHGLHRVELARAGRAVDSGLGRIAPNRRGLGSVTAFDYPCRDAAQNGGRE